MKRRSRSTMAYSSRSLGVAKAFNPTARKISKRRFRSYLWRDSLMSTHYRSVLSFGSTMNTSAGTNSLAWTSISAMDNTPLQTFWKTLGGFQDPSYGITPDWANAPGAGIPEPTTIIIRGGRLFCTVANPSLTETINCRVQLVYIKGQLRNQNNTAASNTVTAYLTDIAAAGARPISWSVQMSPDYHEYLYLPVMDRSIDLKPGDDVMMIHKLKVSKVDVQPFLRGSGMFPIWIIYAGQRIDNTIGAQVLNVNTGYNLSFSVMDTNDI